MPRWIAISLLLLLAIYAGSYVVFRQTNLSRGRTYVAFPTGAAGQALYYIWSPLSYLDSALTGIKFMRTPIRRRVIGYRSPQKVSRSSVSEGRLGRENDGRRCRDLPRPSRASMPACSHQSMTSLWWRLRAIIDLRCARQRFR